MAVYVDDAKILFRGMRMCHMLADTDEELHAMAARLGLKRAWHQAPPHASTSHYDIALTKRALALRYGAIAITWRRAGEIAAARRRIQPSDTSTTP